MRGALPLYTPVSYSTHLDRAGRVEVGLTLTTVRVIVRTETSQGARTEDRVYVWHSECWWLGAETFCLCAASPPVRRVVVLWKCFSAVDEVSFNIIT